MSIKGAVIKHAVSLLVTAFTAALLPYRTWAQTTDVNGEHALNLAQELYCSVANLVSGDMGIMVGLIIAAFGFYQMIRKGISMSILITIFSGVIITAFPAIFEKGMDTLGEVMEPLRDKDSKKEIIGRNGMGMCGKSNSNNTNTSTAATSTTGTTTKSEPEGFSTR